MSNIHGIRDYSNNNNNQRGSSQPGSRGMNAYRTQNDAQPFPGALQPEERGISLMGTAGPMPTMQEKLCPRFEVKTFITIISIIQIIMFVITLIVAAAKFGQAFDPDNSMGGPGAAALRYMGGKYLPDIRDKYEIYRFITPVLLHAGILHIFFNLLFQMRFGYTFELRWTVQRLIIVYVVTGIGATMWSCVLSPGSVSVGASGALFGLLGADISYLALNWAEIPQRGAEACTLVFVVVLNLLTGMSGNIDNAAHGGGLVTGILCAPWILPMLVQKPNEKVIRSVSAFLTVGMYLLFILLIWL